VRLIDNALIGVSNPVAPSLESTLTRRS
jgi:hypothetical protein